jgi:hypothetical protein
MFPVPVYSGVPGWGQAPSLEHRYILTQFNLSSAWHEKQLYSIRIVLNAVFGDTFSCDKINRCERTNK